MMTVKQPVGVAARRVGYLKKIGLVTGLALNGIAVSSVFASAQALTWDFNYISPTGSGSVNAILTTDGSSYAPNIVYKITDIAGTVTDNSIISSIVNLATNVPGYGAVDNEFVWNGTPNILLNTYGIAFEDNAINPLIHNICSGDANGNAILGTTMLSDFASTNLLEDSVTTDGSNITTPPSGAALVTFASLTASTVPEPFNILGVTTGLVLFGTVSTIKRRKLSK